MAQNIIRKLKQRGAYLYGSRAAGVSGPDSDWDFILPATEQNVKFLGRLGFVSDAEKFRDEIIYAPYSRWGARKYGHVPITDLDGFSNETLWSYRKDNINVVLLSPKALGATKYAAKMIKTCPRDQIRDKANRIGLYQRFQQEWAGLMSTELF